MDPDSRYEPFALLPIAQRLDRINTLILHKSEIALRIDIMILTYIT